ncbi:NUMOD4 domain-containing protein [Nocardia sp. N2S4-5]|uniref:NUMOD4 domain-containing protein n=1 Tax=Nocardia sp. N2S4-5 TaxID=3351565 RepID=UPI0037D17E40
MTAACDRLAASAGEIWVPVPGWHGYYEVSSHGRVKSVARTIPHRTAKQIRVRERILKPTTVDDGYLLVTLRRPNERRTVKVHTLVMEAFAGPRPAGSAVCHNNGDPADNRVANLRYDTPAANNRDTVAHGRNPNANKIRCVAGHALTADNVYRQRGRRECRTCRNEASRRYRARRAAA